MYIRILNADIQGVASHNFNNSLKFCYTTGHLGKISVTVTEFLFSHLKLVINSLLITKVSII